MSEVQFFFKLFGSAVIAFGCVLLVIAIRRSVKASKSLKWPNVNGAILQSMVVAQAQGRGRAYVPRVSYEYEIDGISYSGTAITVCDSSLGRAWSQKIVDRYPGGAPVKIYYNPEKPSDALLEPGNITGLLILYAFLFLAIASAVLMMIAVNRQAPIHLHLHLG